MTGCSNDKSLAMIGRGRANFVDRLPGAVKSSFVLTDENGNISAARILKAGGAAMDQAYRKILGRSFTNQRHGKQKIVHVAGGKVNREDLA